MISEIRLVTIGVDSLEESVRFYKDALDFVEVGRGKIAGPELERAWRIPTGLNGHAVVLGAEGIPSGMVRLVQFNKPGERIWGDFSRVQDLGHYAVNFRVRDIHAFWQKVLKVGATQKSAPAYWTVNEDLSAWEAAAFDPNGALLDVFQVEGAITKVMGEQMMDVSEVQTMAIHVSDARKSQQFYQGLGYEVMYDKIAESKDFSEGNMEGWLGVPAGTRLHDINLRMPGDSPNGRIGLCQYIGFPGQPLRDRAVPPNLGILSISFETDDLEQTVQHIEDLSGQLIGGPVKVDLPYTGRVALATFFGPDGEALEFFQKL